MSRYPRLMPARPRLFTGTVLATRPVSPTFQRVTITGADLAEFEWLGLDHWFRLFLPPAPDRPLRLPKVNGRSWYRSYLLIPAAERPHCSNYTVAGFRRGAGGGELDIDVVLHGHDGDLGGAVAQWAVRARAGSPVGFLDQGVQFDPPEDAEEFHLACDETGLPGVRGVLAGLHRAARGTAVLEVPTAADVTPLDAPSRMQVRWLVRAELNGGTFRSTPGQAALAALAEVTPGRDAYAFVVGESGLATGGRRALVRAGLPASRITFSGYWKAA